MRPVRFYVSYRNFSKSSGGCCGIPRGRRKLRHGSSRRNFWHPSPSKSFRLCRHLRTCSKIDRDETEHQNQCSISAQTSFRFVGEVSTNEMDWSTTRVKHKPSSGRSRTKGFPSVFSATSALKYLHLWLCSVAPARLLPLCPVAPAITAAKGACAQETYSNRKGYRSSGLIKDIIVKVFQLADFLLIDADGSEWASRRFPSTERKREFVVGNDWKLNQAARVLCSTSQPFAAVVCNTSHHNIELGTS